MIGKTILHYKIEAKLGEGGMGVVYLAHDLKLDRKVAIKFLPNYISSNEEEKERFNIEAKASASLNHQNIATIYAIEEAGDKLFIAMEYIEGKELRDIVETHRDLPEGKAGASLQMNDIINYAIQIAEGLKAAHNKGIIHRDIKPSNIMVTNDGKIKIMDFGLAKIRGGKEITKIGSTVGTASYMSPEQLKGEDLDNRTDIWSFGVVLYEMLTGKLPFRGEYEQAISYAIVNETQNPAQSYRKDIPKELLFILNKSLAKNIKERYQRSEELLADLKSINGKSIQETTSGNFSYSVSNKKKYIFAAAGILILLITASLIIWSLVSKNESDSDKDLSLKKIAVLPFTNINNDKESGFLSFALADQIINSLAYISDLLVRPSSAIRVYENKSPDLSAVAKELNVEYILSGSYLKVSDQIRLNLELVDISSNTLVWHDGIEVKYENVFKLQDIVSEKVVSGLQVKFSGNNNIKEQDIPKDPLAYEYFLRAVAYPITNEENLIAVDLLKKSIQLDSNFAPAYSELGFRYHSIATYILNKRDKFEYSEAAYKKALAKNNRLLSALGNLAALYTEIGRTSEAVQLIKKALEINPNNAQTHFWLGYIFRYTGLLERSAQEMETAVKLDPTNKRFRSISATFLYLQNFDKAIGYLNIDSNSPYSMAFRGQVYLKMNKLDSAEKYLNKAIDSDPVGTLGSWSKVMLNFIKGKKEDGLKSLKLLESSNTFDAEQFYNYANLYGLFGDNEDCIRLLKKAVEGGFYCYPLFLNDSFLDPVRKDKNFQNVLANAEYKYEQFKNNIGE